MTANSVRVALLVAIAAALATVAHAQCGRWMSVSEARKAAELATSSQVATAFSRSCNVPSYANLGCACGCGVDIPMTQDKGRLCCSDCGGGEKQDCKGSWSPYGQCEEAGGVPGNTGSPSCRFEDGEVKCGGTGPRSKLQKCRTYSITRPASGGGRRCRYDDGETECRDDSSCNKNCLGSWKGWGECQASSEGGAQRCRAFKVFAPAVGDGRECKHAEGEEECDSTGCAVNCEGYWGEWSESDDSRKCRVFEIKTPALRGGSECEHEQGEEECESPIITSRVRVDIDFAEYEERPDYFQNIFKEDVAASLGIDKDRVVIVNVYEGSVIFEFYIENDPDLLAARSLQTKIEEKGKVCVSYASVLDARICKGDACEDGGEDSPITTRVKVDLDFADYEERSEHYQIIFREEVATILGIDKERVVIANVWSGESTMFKFYVTNDPDLAVAETLRTKIEEQGRVCVSYAPVLDGRVCEGDVCIDPITTRVKVDLDIAEYEQRPESYENLFKEEVAVALAIEKSRVVILNVYKDDSTIFEFFMTNDADLAVAETLRTKMQDGSMTISYAQVRQVLICKDDACEKEWGNPVELVRSG